MRTCMLGLLAAADLLVLRLQVLGQEPAALVQFRHEEARHGEPGCDHHQAAGTRREPNRRGSSTKGRLWAPLLCSGSNASRM